MSHSNHPLCDSSESEFLAERVARLERTVVDLHSELESVLHSVSHDLRAPLMSIGGFADLLLEQQENLDENGKRYLERIREGNRRMTLLLEGLVAIAHAAQEPMHPVPIDLVTLAAHVVANLRNTLSSRRVHFEAPIALPVLGDSYLLTVLLEQLLDNAWKFTSKVPDAFVTLGSTRQDNKSCYFIRDNGAGFDPRYQQKLFKPLQRLHAEKQFPGVGAGLAIAAKIVHRHGGKIWASGVIDHGATIYFTLPGPGRS